MVADIETQAYIDRVSTSKEAFEAAFREYVGDANYQDIKGTGLEAIRKGEFADYLLYLQKQVNRRRILR